MSDRRYYVTHTRMAAIGWQTVLIENAEKGEPPDDTAASALRTIRDVLMALVEVQEPCEDQRDCEWEARRGH